MKKIICLSIALLMVFALSIPAFAAEGSFIQSPGKTNPTIEDVDTDIPNYDGKIVIVPYQKKSTLPDDESKLMDEAYGDIAGHNSGSNLNDVLKEIAGENNTTSDKLGISDLFDVHENGNVTYNNGRYTITMAVENVPNYKGLIYKGEDGNWHRLTDAKLSADGKKLTFTTSTLSVPFAIVVEKTGASPKTGDVSLYYIVFALVSSIALAGFSAYKIKALKA